VAELYASAALLVMMADPALAGQIMTNADDLAGSWVKLAAEYPSVRKLLDRLTMTSAVGAFLAVHFRVFGPTLMEKVGGLVTGAGTPGATPGEPSADATVLPGPWMDPTP
jgi:hypothetical protein